MEFKCTNNRLFHLRFEEFANFRNSVSDWHSEVDIHD